MQICYTSDFHGHEVLYQSLGRVLAEERPDLLILGGDMHADGEEPDPPADQRRYVRETFATHLNDWKRDHPALAIAVIFGNHDWSSTMDELRAMQDARDLVLLDRNTPWRFRGVSFLGFSHTPPTPFHVKDLERLDQPGDPTPTGDCSVWDAELAARREVDPAQHYPGNPTLDDLLHEAPPVDAPWIFVCHAPPHNTRLDRLPGIDFPVGSRAVRKFIESRHPNIALHGHIHESPLITGAFHDRVGSTLCINPGQADDQLHAVLFDSDDPVSTLRHTVVA